MTRICCYFKAQNSEKILSQHFGFLLSQILFPPMKFTLGCLDWRHTLSHLNSPYLLLGNKSGEMFGGCTRKKIIRGSRRDQLISLSEYVTDLRENYGQLCMGSLLIWCSQRLPSILNKGREVGALPHPSSCRWNLSSRSQKDTCLMTGKQKSGDS